MLFEYFRIFTKFFKKQIRTSKSSLSKGACGRDEGKGIPPWIFLPGKQTSHSDIAEDLFKNMSSFNFGDGQHALLRLVDPEQDWVKQF